MPKAFVKWFAWVSARALRILCMETGVAERAYFVELLV